MAPDYGFRGFFELTTPQQLLRKLQHDHTRLRENPLDTYAAFDFFVTANSMVDWVWPSATGRQKRDNRRADTIPRICEHLANGAKHFSLSTPHTAVERTTRHGGARLGVMRLGAARLGDPGRMIVTLKSAEAEELGKRDIPVLELADLVLAYWERRCGYV